MIYKNSKFQKGIKFSKKKEQPSTLFTPTQLSTPPFTSRTSTSPIPILEPNDSNPSSIDEFYIIKPQTKTAHTPVLQNREMLNLQRIPNLPQSSSTNNSNKASSPILHKHLSALINLRSIVSNECSKFKPTLQVDPLVKRLEEETKSYTNSIEISNFYDYTKTCMSIIIELLDSKDTAIKPKKVKIKNEYNDKGTRKKLAVFDIDETLIHCVIKDYENCKHIINIKMPTGKETKIGLNIRPYWQKAITRVMKYYTVVAYTASHQLYADAVLDYLDPDKQYFYNRLYRNNCINIKHEGKVIYVKDMDIFEGYDLNEIVIIDNSVMSFAFHLENGIPILPYYEGEHDVELMFCACYLENIVNYDDLRDPNKIYMKLGYYLEQARKEEENEEEEEDDDDDNEKLQRSQCFTMKCLINETTVDNENSGSSTPKVRRRQKDTMNAIKYYEFRSNWERMIKKKGNSLINGLINDFESMRKVFNKEMNKKYANNINNNNM